MLYKKLTEIARTSREFQMATQASFTDVINQIDGATNVVAAILEDLKKKIAGGGLDAATEDAVLTQLQASADKLKSMGSPPVVV